MEKITVKHGRAGGEALTDGEGGPP